MPIKVRVGQSDAIKILASAGGGSIESVTSRNVIGGIASVSQLNVLGISTLSNVVSTGIITASSFVGPLTGDVTGTASTALTALNFSPLASLNISNLNVTGLSTFVGIVTTNNDLFVGGDFSVKGNIDLGRIQGSALNITGISTFNEDVVFRGANYNMRWDRSTSDLTLFNNTRLIFGDNTDFQIWHGGSHTFLKNSGGELRIRGDKILLKIEDGSEKYLEATKNQDVKLFFNDNEKLATTDTGVNITGTLTAGLIDGGSFWWQNQALDKN